jgi:hypothetical protein
MLKRRTETNEPTRCATLLPLLALLPKPLALLEIGASAGLCLLPDLYGYEYNGTVHISPTTRATTHFTRLTEISFFSGMFHFQSL